ncbi:MAG: hypothetical protein Fur0037_05790 [Planctomycetota bacterium]
MRIGSEPAVPRFLALMAFLVRLTAQDPVAAPLPRAGLAVADYRIKAELDTSSRSIAGSAEIRWRNATPKETGELRFHLYLNAFRDLDSTFLRESDEAFRRVFRPSDFGGLDIEKITGADGAEIRGEYVSPDDGNPHDRTVLRVPLAHPVPAGGEAAVRIEFRSRLPKAYRRTGWVPGGGFYCMHWYPILGVLQVGPDGEARWNCHQFHANTEFFADFASFRVELTMPSNLVVGATGGEPESVVDRKDGRTTRTWQIDAALPVHNFAFVADPGFVVATDTFGPMKAADDPSGMAPRVASLLGRPVESFDLPATKIRLLLHEEHDVASIRERCMQALKVGLEFYGLRYGPYPYATITAVDAAADVAGRGLGGGMEYPTLITLGTRMFPHAGRLAPEGVAVHEFGHQYWYGLSANNEFEESWLDEGINTFSQGRAHLLGFAPEPRLASGRAMKPVAVSDFGMWSLAAIRGPFAGSNGLAPRRDLPGIWRLPYWHELASAGFDGTWMPASPLLEVVRCQPQVAWFPGVESRRVWTDRARFLSSRTPDAMVVPGWLYAEHDSYRVNSYQRPAVLLREIERMVESREKGRFWAFLRAFHEASRFRHPTTDEFVALLRERCGDGVADWFLAASGAGAVLDYGLAGAPETRDGTTIVRVRRYGNLAADVSIRFTFEKGKGPLVRTIPRTDDSVVHVFEFREDPAEPRGRLIEVWIDPPEIGDVEEAAWPAGVHILDSDLTNNGWRGRSDPAPARQRALRMLLQAQCELSFGGLIG